MPTKPLWEAIDRSKACRSLLCALVLIPALPGVGHDVLTYHNNNERTGLNSNELALEPGNVSATNFGLRFNLEVDGKVDAQPLYATSVPVTTADGAGVRRNLVVVATEHDSVYAFDADRGVLCWKASLLGDAEVPSDDRSCHQVTPEIGITATPVIDRRPDGTGCIYLVAMSRAASSPIYHQRLHALDLATGEAKAGSPVEITAEYPGRGPGNNGRGQVVFDPAQYKERAGLLLLNNLVITVWASHCDYAPYTGWMIAYDKASLAQASVLNVNPNGIPASDFLKDGSGVSFWNSGAAPAGVSSGYIYLISANGPFDTNLVNGFPRSGSYGNSLIKLSVRGGLRAFDYFTPYDQQNQAQHDSDLGSGGAMLLNVRDTAGTLRYLLVGAGKNGNLYVANRVTMGKINLSSANNSNLYQEVMGAVGPAIFGAPAYFNEAIYYGPVQAQLRRFAVQNAKVVPSPTSLTRNSFGYPGTTPSVSAFGTSRGIVWAYENAPDGSAVLHAYDALDLARELYSSAADRPRDAFGAGNKFIVPTITGGKVFVGTTHSVGVFGLLNPAPAAVVNSSIRTQASPVRFNTQTSLYEQTVVVKNIGAKTLPGPFSLALDGLTPAATLANADGATTLDAAGVSPFVTIASLNGLVQGATLTFELRFATPKTTVITYRTRVFSGYGPR